MIEMLLNVWDYILVFIMAAIPWLEIMFVIPVSILAGMNAFWVGLLSFLGNLATVYILVLFFDKLKDWWQKRKRKRSKKPDEEKSNRYLRAERMWHKYGVPGLTVSGPILIGAHIAAAAAMALGSSKRKTLYWMTISLGIWTLIFTLGTVFGIGIFTN